MFPVDSPETNGLMREDLESFFCYSTESIKNSNQPPFDDDDFSIQYHAKPRLKRFDTPR